MTVLTNRTRAGGFIQSEANHARSRDKVTIDGSTAGELGKTLYAGTVLGKITSSGKYVISVKTASDGSQVPAVILFDDVGVSGGISGDAVATVIAREAEVRAEDLTLDASWTAAVPVATGNPAAPAGDWPTIIADLAASPHLIIVRYQNDTTVGAPAQE